MTYHWEREPSQYKDEKQAFCDWFCKEKDVDLVHHTILFRGHDDPYIMHIMKIRIVMERFPEISTITLISSELP